MWGREENSPFFTLLPEIMEEHGVEMKQDRTNFHLNDKLDQVIAEAGFKNIKTVYQSVHFNESKESIFVKQLFTPTLIKLWETLDDELKQSISEKFLEALEERFGPDTQKMISYESLIAVAEK